MTAKKIKSRCVASCSCSEHYTGKLPYESTADGPVPRHTGEWKKLHDEWCVIVPMAGDPKPGHFVRVHRKDGTTKDKLLGECVHRGVTKAIFAVRDYDGRYSDLDPEPYSW